MLKNSLIIIPFQLPWDWSADYQFQTCQELAKKNLVVAYMNEDASFFLKPRPTKIFPKLTNVLFYQPRYLLPLRRFAVIEKLNQLFNIWYLLVRYSRGKERSILWLFDPAFWFYPQVKLVFPKLTTLYDCVDFVWQSKTKLRKFLQTQEKKLIKSVDFFLVNSQVLAKLHTKTRPPNAVVPQGFRLKDFQKPKKTTVEFPKDKPIIGLVGAIDYRFDFVLLTKLIKQNPQWYFVLWGPVQEAETKDIKQTNQQIAKLKTLNNVIFGQSTDRREIPNIIKQFDVCMIPYDTKLASVRYSYPMKLFEYFYLGKPIVSTPIVELKNLTKYVKIGRSPQEWQDLIRSVLTPTWSKQLQAEQNKMAIANSWERKISAISLVIEQLESNK